MAAPKHPVSPSIPGCDARGSRELDGRTGCAGISVDVLVIYALAVSDKETTAEDG